MAQPCTSYTINQCEGHFFCAGATCPKSNRAVWGGGVPHSPSIYTGDSSPCAAARHAGIIDASGGTYYLSPEPGRGKYSGSTQNGVRTNDWDDYPSSFSVSPSTAFPMNNNNNNGGFATTNRSSSLSSARSNNFGGGGGGNLCSSYQKDSCSGTFSCPGASLCQVQNGTIWGIGPNGEQIFTGDSMAICGAARFCGVIGIDGGKFRLTPVGGQPNFIGGLQNGIAVRTWKDYPVCYVVSAVVGTSANDMKPGSTRIDNQAMIKSETYF